MVHFFFYNGQVILVRSDLSSGCKLELAFQPTCTSMQKIKLFRSLFCSTPIINSIYINFSLGRCRWCSKLK